jgi:deoxyribodipyrimidine photo-lyase
MPTALWWIRRDLRLHDNPALTAAREGGRGVVPVFVLDDRLLRGPSSSIRRNQFLLAGLAELDASLQRLGSRLILRRGDPARELRRLARETAATAIFAEIDHTPFARHGDAEIAAQLPVEWINGVTIHPPEFVVRGDGSPFTVFGAFRRAWNALPPPSDRGLYPAPKSLPAVPNLASEAPDLAEAPQGFPPGEAEALRRLERFLDGPILRYGDRRNRLDLEGTSALSPYFRFGMLSARAAMVRALDLQSGAQSTEERGSIRAWIDELIWREFYIAVLWHHPDVLREAFRPLLRRIRWENRGELFEAWRSGQTGYPVVDAAMRQLARAGWMHNRARMIVASFLTKDLRIDWRLGQQWFMRNLIDGDPAANNGGWQWTAGTGTDAAPYFRIFNPVLQSMKFDPDGDFIRRFVPELRNVTGVSIHSPWKMPPDVQRRAGCLIGRDYPAPIVEHQQARERTLLAYKRSSAAAQGRRHAAQTMKRRSQ